MKIYSTILFLLFSLLVFSQEIIKETDSITNLNENIFIQDHTRQLNIKFDVSNNQLNYFFPYNGVTASVRTNLNISYGFVFSYKYLSVRLGVRPKLSDSEERNKGKTDNFRIGFKLLFNQWSHAFEYNYRRGFYVDNSKEVSGLENNGDFYVQFPNLTTNTFSGVTQYKFNDNYSVKAVESNTEIQLKSAGSFIPGISYTIYTVKGTDKLKIKQDETIIRDNFNDYYGITLVLEPSYHYTFVLHKYWYANVFGAPGLGFDFYNTTYYLSDSNSYDEKFSNIFFSIETGAAIGYNGEKFYFGSEFKYNLFSNNFDDNYISLQPTRTKFHVFIGYRFKAPKQVAKPIDYIEEKVPVLKNNNI